MIYPKLRESDKKCPKCKVIYMSEYTMGWKCDVCGKFIPKFEFKKK